MQIRGTVHSQRPLAADTFCLRVTAPELAAQVLPGQFMMIRPEAGNDPLLGRPFALYNVIDDATGRPRDIEFVYHVVGKLTTEMASWTGGESVVLWGPLGNGFPVPTGRHLLCVGGGIGYTPFPAVIREALGRQSFGAGQRIPESLEAITFCYAAQTRKKLADLEGIADLPGVTVRYATDDGSFGHHGWITDLVNELLTKQGGDRPNEVFCCGPEPMMKAVATLCEQQQVDCWLSLETPMACGFGACFSCVAKVKTSDGWDYRRTCVEGPIFRAECLDLT